MWFDRRSSRRSWYSRLEVSPFHPLPQQALIENGDAAATAQLIALLHRIPPPKLTDIAKSDVGPSSSGDYRALPRAASADTRRSVSIEGIADRHISDGSEDEPYKALGHSIAEYDDPATQEEMGRLGWWVLGWSFTASAAITVSTFPQAGHFQALKLHCVFSWRASCSRSFLPCRYSISLGQFSGPVSRPAGRGGEWCLVERRRESLIDIRFATRFSPSLSYVGQGMFSFYAYMHCVC